MNAKMIKDGLVSELSRIGYMPDSFIIKSLENALLIETSEIARDILSHLLENASVASEMIFPLCQDTGLAVFWVKVGRDLCLEGINLDAIINEAVSESFAENSFRYSVVGDPIRRENTKTNTPAIIHYEYVSGNGLEIAIMLKGGGAENMSALRMLPPSAGIDGIREFVIETVRTASGNACPPLFVGVGVGGNFEMVALLAKRSLFRRADERNTDAFWAAEEVYLLDAINKLGIGAMGLGGITTALGVNIEVLPCHIASLPVAVNLECHAHRLGGVRL